MNKQLSRIFAWSLALLPILDVYASFVPYLSIGQLFIIIVSLFAFVYLVGNRVTNVKLNRYLLVFFIYIIAVSLLSLLNSYSDKRQLLLNIFSMALYFFLIWIGHNFFDLAQFRKSFILLAFATALLGLIQYVLSLFGYHVLFLVPFLKLENGANLVDLYANYTRIQCCFAEPAHFAHYLSVGIILILSKEKLKRMDVFMLLVMVVVSLLTMSGNAIIALAAITIAYIYRRFRTRKNLLKTLALITVIAIGVFAFSYADSFVQLLNRVDEIKGNSVYSISGYVRVLRGYELFIKFPFINKVFGIGIGNVGSFCIEYGIQGSVAMATSHDLFTYLNGFQYFLIGGGIIGIVLYMVFLFGNSNKSNLHFYTLTLIIALSLIAALYLSSIWLVLIIIILGEKNEKNRDRVREDYREEHSAGIHSVL